MNTFKPVDILLIMVITVVLIGVFTIFLRSGPTIGKCVLDEPHGRAIYDCVKE